MTFMHIISIIVIVLQESKALTTDILLNGDIILGHGNFQLKCLVHKPDPDVNVFLTLLEAYFEDGFKTIAVFHLPSANTNASLADAGKYLTNRVILTNPNTPDVNGLYEAIMTYKSITCEDEKQYRCNVFHSGEGTNSLSNVTTIFVKGMPQKPYSIPLRDPDTNVCPGMSISFTCEGIIGKPPGYFKWSKFINGSYNVYSTNTTVTANPETCLNTGTSMLSIEVQKEDNNAVFKCEVVHELADNDTFQQTEPEDFIYDPLEFTEIMKIPNRTFYDQTIPFIDLTCSANSCHHPTITWHKDTDLNTTIGNGSSYRISEIIEENSGTYICKIHVIDNGTEHNQTDSVYIEIRSVTFTESEKDFVETVVGIVTITLASVATTALTSFAVFKIVQKSRHLRMLNIIHAQDVEPVKSSEPNTETTPNMDNEGFQSEVSQQTQNSAPVQTAM